METVYKATDDKDKKEYADSMTPSQLKSTYSRLKGARGTWEQHWQEIADHMMPLKNTITNYKSPGQKRTWQLLDNTGVHSNEMLAGTLQNVLTNPDLPWFEYTTGDIQLDQDDEVKKWLQKTSRDTHNVLNNSNFQTELHELYMDLTSLATGCMFIEEDPRFTVRFSTKFIADYVIAENNLGYVDQVYRAWMWSAVQIIEEFGIDKVPEEITKAFKTGSDEKFRIIHGVYPKSLTNPQFSGKKKFRSQYILDATEKELSSGEYTEFPYTVPRWSKAPGEVYGRGPGMTALPEMKVLNKMNETMLRGAQKVVDPPIQMPDDGYVMPISTGPAGINYYRPGNPDDRIKPIFNDTRIDFGYQVMSDIRKRVRDAFYVDQLKLGIDQKYMTAQEVMQRTEESMRLLGPMLGRMQSEFLRPLIDRVFRIMWDRGLIATPPDILSGVKLDMRYSSMIAKSQRVNEGQSMLRVMQSAAPFLQLDQSLAMIFDGESAVRTFVTTFGAPQEMLRDKKVVAQMRQQQQQAQVEAQQQQQMAQQAQMEQGQVDNALTLTKAAKEAQGL